MIRALPRVDFIDLGNQFLEETIKNRKVLTLSFPSKLETDFLEWRFFEGVHRHPTEKADDIYREGWAEVHRILDDARAFERAVEVGSLDAVINANELRPVLIKTLKNSP